MSDRSPVEAADASIYVNRLAAVTEVLPSVAHDLNNCLQVIGGLAEMLVRQPTPIGDGGTSKAERIREQAHRAMLLMRDVVAFSRRDDVRRSRVDVRRAVERALTFRRYALSKAAVTVDVDLPPDTVLLADVDSQWLEQILVNVILEVERALASPEPRRVRVSVVRAGTRILAQFRYAGALGRPSPLAGANLLDPRVEGVGPTVAAMMAERLRGRLTFLEDRDGTTASLELPASDLAS